MVTEIGASANGSHDSYLSFLHLVAVTAEVYKDCQYNDYSLFPSGTPQWAPWG